AISQGLFFIAFLFFQRPKTAPNYLLIVWLVMIIISLSHSYLISSGLILDYIHLLGIDGAVPFTCGPFLYLYALLLTRKIKSLEWHHSLHLIPFFGYLIFLSTVLYFHSAEYKLGILNQEISMVPSISPVVTLGAKIIHALSYAVMAFRLVFEHDEETTLKSISRKQLLIWLYGALMLVNLAMLGAWFSLIFPGSILTNLSFPSLTLVLFAVIYLIVFFALKYPGLFEQVPLEAKPRYAQSPLRLEEADTYWKRLTDLMDTSKPYTKPDLTVSELASELGTSSKLLSQVINEKSGQNFTSFVNRYRVKAFKSKLEQQAHHQLTLVAIAQECGFPSKSSFYSVFKKVENCTPREYLQAHQKLAN
ncbi:MAG: helix-turn-helix domain-containing protein, partial [Bacteroidota bacterium]